MLNNPIKIYPILAIDDISAFTPTGESIRIYLPLASIPQPEVDGADAGSFKRPDNLNHNSYETNFAQLVISHA
jgi:hypothetical protein